LAAVQEGDTIIIDTAARRLDVDLTDEEIASRLASWSPPRPKYDRGVMAKYAAMVTQANDGAVMRVGFDL
jgi:dihydroxy-acid dehydratase